MNTISITLKRVLRRLFGSVYAVFRQRVSKGKGQNKTHIYSGYGTSKFLVLAGRITSSQPSQSTSSDISRWQNLWNNSRLFFNDERKNIASTVFFAGEEHSFRTDHEGYFEIRHKLTSSISSGWHPIHTSQSALDTLGEFLIIPPENTVGIISDVDDTILHTNVSDKRKMLLNTFLLNAQQRIVVEGMQAVICSLLSQNAQPDQAAMFYLSASPRQLHKSIIDFLSINKFPKGVLITKLVSDEIDSEPWLDQVSYKIDKISEVLKNTLGTNFYLLGDNVESDPDIYEQIRRLHPERILGIWIRLVNPADKKLALRIRPLKIAGVEDLVELLTID